MQLQPTFTNSTSFVNAKNLVQIKTLLLSKNDIMKSIPSVKIQAPNFNFVGKNKTEIKQLLLRLDYEFVEFVHWLYVPNLGLLLSFDTQYCNAMTVNCYNDFFAGELHENSKKFLWS